MSYTPPRTTSRYKLDTLGSAWRSHQMDMTADPGVVGARPNPDYLALSDPAVRAAYERRYGPDTAGNRFKCFEGGGNETLGSVWSPAITWAHGVAHPTMVEMLDAVATNDVAMVRAYLVAVVDGYTPERRVHINDPARPHGPLVESSFWGIPLYLYNDAERVEPPIDPPPVDDDPPPVDPPVDPPPPHVCPPAWARVPAGVLRDAEKIAGWDVVVAGPAKVRGAKSLAARVLAYDVWWRTNHPGAL